MKSALQSINERIYKIYENERNKWLKVSLVLAKLDISTISSDIKYKHPTYSIDSLIKLYLYKRVKGIYSYPSLMEDLNRKDILNLGFKNSIPVKRSLNKFLRNKIDSKTKKVLDSVAQDILTIATEKGKILDIEIVRKTIKKKVKSTKELKEALAMIKRLVYPQIDLKIAHNAIFTSRDLLDVLVHIAYTNDFANNGSFTFRELNPERKYPSGDTLMYHFSKFESISEIKAIFRRIFDVVFHFAKREYFIIRKRRVDIAIDVHQIPYYGDRTDDYVCGGKNDRGTNKFFQFLTCAIVVAGRRFTIDAIPIHPIDRLENLVDEIIKRVKRKVHIDKAYLDRGFDKVSVINVLKSNNVRFLMPKVKSPTVKAWFDKSEDCKARVIKNFQIGVKKKAFVNLILVDNEDGIKRAFMTNFNVPEQMAHYLYSWYSKRWGIETSYRNMRRDFNPRTTSKNYHIRLFYFLFSVCLYNLWILVNICISIALHGKVLDKPLITAKMFAIVLYRVYVDVG